MSLIDIKFTGSISTTYLMFIMKKLKILMALVQYDSVTTFEMTVNCGYFVMLCLYLCFLQSL